VPLLRCPDAHSVPSAPALDDIAPLAIMGFMGKGKTSPPPSPPVITPEEGIQRLHQLLARTEALMQKVYVTDDAMEAYRAALDSALGDAFGLNSDWHLRVRKAGKVGIPEEGWDVNRVRVEELSRKRAVLPEAIADLQRRATRAVVATPMPPSALRTVENILRRFHRVATQLTRRHANRATLEIEDEYDVQDLLHGLLLVSFADVRPEEYGPSQAGARPRFDFLLKAEDIVIEVKKTRDSLSTADLASELLADIARYRSHPNCKTLVCFIYDPDGRIMNAEGLIHDLETSAPMPVRVFIVPSS